MEVGDRTIGIIAQGEKDFDAILAAADFIDGELFLAFDCHSGLWETAPPVQLSKPEAIHALRQLWIKQGVVYAEDLTYINTLLHQATKEGTTHELLNQVGFRTSCYRLGAMEGWPVRCYGADREGLLWEDNYLWWSQGCPGDGGVPMYDLGALWLVLAEVPED